jgi:hypothetical protein
VTPLEVARALAEKAEAAIVALRERAVTLRAAVARS